MFGTIGIEKGGQKSEGVIKNALQAGQEKDTRIRCECVDLFVL